MPLFFPALISFQALLAHHIYRHDLTTAFPYIAESQARSIFSQIFQAAGHNPVFIISPLAIKRNADENSDFPKKNKNILSDGRRRFYFSLNNKQDGRLDDAPDTTLFFVLTRGRTIVLSIEKFDGCMPRLSF